MNSLNLFVGKLNSLNLFVGKSGSGKSTIANMLEAHGYKVVQSYTTRAPRYDGEKGHTFISDDEFDKLRHIVAYTEYNGHHYCTTAEQINECDIYVIDPEGVNLLLQTYNNTDRKINVIYFDASLLNRIERMRGRGDTAEMVVERIWNDEEIDWTKQLNYYILANGERFDCVTMQIVDVNYDEQDTFNKVYDIVRRS